MRVRKVDQSAVSAARAAEETPRKAGVRKTHRAEPMAQPSPRTAAAPSGSFLEQHPKVADALGFAFMLGLYSVPALAGAAAAFGSGVARGVGVAVLGAVGVAAGMVSSTPPKTTSNEPTSRWM
ncbi:MAG: hypothetical protein AAB426_00870 [Myxococcota bacterium]